MIATAVTCTGLNPTQVFQWAWARGFRFTETARTLIGRGETWNTPCDLHVLRARDCGPVQEDETVRTAAIWDNQIRTKDAPCAYVPIEAAVRYLVELGPRDSTHFVCIEERLPDDERYMMRAQWMLFVDGNEICARREYADWEDVDSMGADKQLVFLDKKSWLVARRKVLDVLAVLGQEIGVGYE